MGLKPFITKSSPVSAKSTSGPVFIGLNVLRALSIIALLLVFVANIVTIVSDIKAVKADKASAAEATSTVTATATTSAITTATKTATTTASASATETPDKRALSINARRILYEPFINNEPSATESAVASATAALADLNEANRIDPDMLPDIYIGGVRASFQKRGVPEGFDCEGREVIVDNDDEYEWVYEDELDDHDDTPALPHAAIALAANVTSNDTDPEPVYECDYYKGATVPSQTGGTFWSVLNRIFLMAEAVLLILSEFGFPKALFTNYIPMLGQAYGLGCLGVLQTLIASGVLSHHCDLFAQVAGWLLFIVAMANILAGIFLREKAKSKRSLFKWENYEDLTPQTRLAAAAWHTVSDWKEKASSAPSTYSQPTAAATPPRATTPAEPYVSSPARDEPKAAARLSVDPEPIEPGARFGGFPWGKQARLSRGADKTADERGFKISRPLETLPSG